MKKASNALRRDVSGMHAKRRVNHSRLDALESIESPPDCGGFRLSLWDSLHYS